MTNTLIALDDALIASDYWRLDGAGSDWAIYANGDDTCWIQYSTKDPHNITVQFCGNRMGSHVECHGTVTIAQALEIAIGDLHAADLLA